MLKEVVNRVKNDIEGEKKNRYNGFFIINRE